MIDAVEVVRHGREATEALARVVADAKAVGPMAPVTVVVPSNLAGLAARRVLGAGVVGTGGLVNVQFFTPFRLAELLGTSLVTDRRPLTNPVLGAAVRQVLATAPGRFAAVAEHHATEVALVAMFRELSQLDDHQLDAVADADATARESVRLYREISTRLTGHRTEQDLAAAAAGRDDLRNVLAPFGHVVLHSLEPLPQAMCRLLATVTSVADGSAVVTLVEDTAADRATLATWTAIGVDVPYGAGNGAATASAIVTASDADEEVRAVVQRVMALAHDGVPMHRIGIFHPSSGGYGRTIEQQLAAAGVPANGPRRTRLADSVVGRTVMAALALPSQRWRRDRVMALVADAPVRHAGHRVDSASWEELSRLAHVVRDLADWDDKVDVTATRLDGRRNRSDIDVAQLDRDISQLRAMQDFVVGLDALLGAIASADGWGEKMTALTALLDDLLGTPEERIGWPDLDRRDADAVADAIARLAELDELEPDPSMEVVRRALQAELVGVSGRTGRFGVGVLHGPLETAVGQDLDAVFVVGLAEGLCPGPRGDDALVPDAAREASGGALPLRSERLHDQHRWLCAALESAPAQRRVLTFPRGDLRGGRRRTPSRWLLPTAGELAGTAVPSTSFGDLSHPVVDVRASHIASLRTPSRAASLLERDLGALIAHVDADGDAIDHEVTEPIRRGFEATRARASDRFTEWDGNLGGQPTTELLGTTSISATSLQRWATCGMSFFLASVLGIGGRDEPELIHDLQPLDRGTVLHRILERFLGEAIEAGRPGPGEPWAEADRTRLAQIADEEFELLRRRGLTGRSVNWQYQSSVQHDLLQQWLEHDSAERERTGATPTSVELPFGRNEQAVTITLPSGRTLDFHGAADRVDVDGDGHHVVYDYKASGARSMEGFRADPFVAGQKLQLGLYSEAALQVLGGTSAEAHYWLIHEKAGNSVHHGYRWDDEKRARFVELVDGIVAGIESGVFPAVSGAYDTFFGAHENCRYCDFDDVCARDRHDQLAVKWHDPALRALDVLLPPDDEADR